MDAAGFESALGTAVDAEGGSGATVWYGRQRAASTWAMKRITDGFYSWPHPHARWIAGQVLTVNGSQLLGA